MRGGIEWLMTRDDGALACILYLVLTMLDNTSTPIEKLVGKFFLWVAQCAVFTGILNENISKIAKESLQNDHAMLETSE